MLANVDFSPIEWREAPIYESQSRSPELLVLDFDMLHELAELQRAQGAFREDDYSSFTKAPLFVDAIPAAIYDIKSENEHNSGVRESADPEMLVVMSGFLKVLFPKIKTKDGSRGAGLLPMKEGSVVVLNGQDVSLAKTTPTEHFEQKSCLVLALYEHVKVQTLPRLI